MSQTQTINISTSTILRVVLILLGLGFLFLVKDILLMVFVAVLVATAVNEPVSWLQKHKIPRLLGVVFIYLAGVLLFSVIVTLILPPLITQIKQLTIDFPEFMDKISTNLEAFQGKYRLGNGLGDVFSNIGGRLDQITPNIFSAVVNLFGGIFSTIVVLVISFYLTVQERGARKFLVGLMPREHQHYFSGLIDRIQSKIGGWVRGELLLMSIVGAMVYAGLLLLGVKYALLLALIAAFLEIVPYIGPIMSTVPAAILAFTQSPTLALLVILLYVIVQQLENYIIVPQIMKRTVGLNPIVIIIVMLIGAKLAGVLGLILAVPLTAAMAEFLGDLLKERI